MQQTFDTWTITEKTPERQIEAFVTMLQELAGGPHGYRLRRILLTNFWLYGLQEFEIPHGRLFLAGENASGKSTVLTAALPLALDGDLRPNRIDTFGGRERHIDYYVLGSADSATPFQYERRTAYIALEFEWCDPDHPPIAQEIRQRWENANAEQREKLRFLTIGISLAGNANVSERIRPLRFLITDGSRLGHDLHTVSDISRQEKRAYDHAHFKQLLEGHGIICESQAEYERQVGRYLFGYTDVKDFRKLINLLLVLRRPNLSTELNFSRVHEYLKQSLRKIPTETTHRVIGTIERIDAIQSEIERIQEAYDSTERLHRAVQQLVLTRVQMAGNEYVEAQQTEDAIQSKATKLRREVTTADNERKKADARSQSLQEQLYQVIGQIRALESSEGLQLAKQLTTTRERMQESEAQMHLQEQSLESVRQTLRTTSSNLEHKHASFAKAQTDITTSLSELRVLASEECYWEVAAFQLEESLRSVTAMSTETTPAPQIPQGVFTLAGELAQERISWLRHLEELHQQRERADNKVQNARSLETTRFQELDEARRRFQAIQDRSDETRQKLNETLEQWLTSNERILPTEDIDTSLASIELEEATQAADGTEGNESARVLAHLASALESYRHVIELLERESLDAVDQVQGELNELQLSTGSKNHEISELQALYDRKLAEPEYVPPRSERRTLARIKLAEQGIAALPLYMLLDFSPSITEHEAGRIEYALEDAGLLDALVVAPTQIATADTILANEGLSDCRLNLSPINNPIQQNQGLQKWLQFDTAMQDSSITEASAAWKSTTEHILAQLGHSHVLPHANFILDEDGSWTHGLLAGRASRGNATCIGKATRLRVRQRELDALNEQLTQLNEELRELHQRLAHYEQQIAQLQEQQGQIRKLLPGSGIEDLYAQLAQAQLTLADASGKYQKARQQTQEARQAHNALVAQLERKSQGIGSLSTSTKQVQRAIESTMSLRTQGRSLQLQLRTLVQLWEDYQRDKASLEKAKSNEINVANLYERVRQQALQAQAEFQELQQITEHTNVEELGERLRSLREQNDELSKQLDDTKAVFIRADERTNAAQAQLTEIEEQLQVAHAEAVEKQTRFIQHLSEYPVERLLEAQQLATNSANNTSNAILRAAHNVLADISTSDEGNVLSRKERLDTAYRDAYNALSKTFNREQTFLLEYGPDLDDQGHVRFLNENKSRPIDLLTLLSERIEMQRTLLGQEERQLFEDFLLQEIAEAIRTHILEAEEWVQQINAVLSGLPMIGEHYSLQWKSLGEYDPSMLGSHLAQNHKLLRKPAQTLTTEESETLMAAFRQEIETVRLRQQEAPDMNFMDALEQVFDYREWFHFDVWVTPVSGGQRQRLTDRVAGTRSGAEQLFALYVPLFAALGALYRAAAPGAPRLLALDEAFDKVSVANTQRIMEFLVSQDFQWIMTGPQVSGTGAKIPASVRYLMLHEKGSPIATASASFWSNSLDIQTGRS